MEEKGTNSAEGGCEIGTRFEARLALVPAATSYLSTQMRQAGATPDAILRAELILEELFRNSVLHGYRGDSDQPVWIAASAHGFSYADQAPPFNPLTDAPAGVAPDPALPIDAQPVGGAGLLLIRDMARSVDYVRDGSVNRLNITVWPERQAAAS